MQESMRDTTLAQSLTEKAVGIASKRPDEAEKFLREALNADLYYGPAHNNLGVVYLDQGKLYEAAAEFEWARKLLPGHPDPRMNLALTLEVAGRTDEALSTYATALEVYPEHLPTIQALARLQLRAKKSNENTKHYLEDIALRGEDDTWKSWARLQLARIAP